MKKSKLPEFSSELELLAYKVKDRITYVRYYEGGVQAGFPSPAEDFEEQRLSLDEKYIGDPNTTFLIRCRGMSMYPTFQPNDLLIAKSDYNLLDTGIGIVSVNKDKYTAKRYDKQKECLTPDNEEYPVIYLKEFDEVECLGVVKHIIRDV